jgi:hypothetical protein
MAPRQSPLSRGQIPGADVPGEFLRRNISKGGTVSKGSYAVLTNSIRCSEYGVWYLSFGLKKTILGGGNSSRETAESRSAAVRRPRAELWKRYGLRRWDRKYNSALLGSARIVSPGWVPSQSGRRDVGRAGHHRARRTSPPAAGREVQMRCSLQSSGWWTLLLGLAVTYSNPASVRATV